MQNKKKILLLPPMESTHIFGGDIATIGIFDKLSEYQVFLPINLELLDPYYRENIKNLNILNQERNGIKGLLGFIRNIFFALRVDFIVCHGEYWGSVLYSFLVSLASRKKYIIMIHIENHFLEHKLLYKIAFKHSKEILVLANKDTLNRLNFWLRGKKWQPFQVGIEDQFFKRPISNEKEFDCIFVGTLEERKGLEYMLEIFTLLVQLRPYSKILILAGNSLPDKINFVKNYLETKKIQKNFTILNRVSREQLIEYYDKSKVNIMTSIYEGVSLVMMEAISRGVPTICFDLPFTEVMQNVVIRIKFPDIETYVEKITQILDNGITENEKKRLIKFAYDNYTYEHASIVMKNALNNVFE